MSNVTNSEDAAVQDQRRIRAAARELLATDYSQAPAVLRRLRDPADRARLLQRCARAYMNDWRLLEALQLSEESIGTGSAGPQAYLFSAEIYCLIGNRRAALDCVKRAVELDPLVERPRPKILSGAEVDQLFPMSMADVSAALERRGHSHESVLAAARRLVEVGQCDAAIDILKRAMRSCQQADVLDELNFCLGQAHETTRDFCLAIEHYANCAGGKWVRRSLTAKAMCFMELGRFEEAASIFNDLQVLDGNVSDSSYGSLKMRRGQFKDVWLDLRRRDVAAALSSVGGNYCQELEKIPVEGQIFLLAEDGPGDEICVASIYADLAHRFRNLIISCDPRLHSLFSRSFPTIRFFPAARWRPHFPGSFYALSDQIRSRVLARVLNNETQELAKRSDAFCSVSDLLADLRPDPQAFPRRLSYLTPEPNLVDSWRSLIGKCSDSNLPRVALSWRSFIKSIARDFQYLAAADLVPLADIPAEIWLFQPGLEAEEISILRETLPNVQIPKLDMLDDFEGMAAFLVNMDLVVSPCTTTGELAGALGVRTLLFACSEITRGRERNDGSDLWHSNAQIISGRPLGNQAATAAAIRNALAKEVSSA